MSGALEGVATSWLKEESWQKVFKHTCDVIEDYVTYLLIATGTISLSVRLLTTLGTGDVQCILLLVNSTVDTDEDKDLGPYPSGGTLGLVNYAQTSAACSHAVFNWFWLYLPYVMLIQTIFLVIVEKFTFKIPRIAQKVERFYRNIVDEALFGKDPDVAEDVSDPKASIEAISRERQRNEICITLKRSSIIYRVYLLKNVFEVFLVLVLFLPMNLFYVLDTTFLGEELCRISLQKVPGSKLDEEGEAIFQCAAKKSEYFELMIWFHICFVILHALCSVGSIIWCLCFRKVSQVIRQIHSLRGKQDPLIHRKDHQLINNEGEDFLFLFDLLSHTCGIESTLRVLTHSDVQFYEIFKPNLHPTQYLTLEEDRLKISWFPSDVEKWSRDQRENHVINIESYEVTIFPAERVNNTQSVPSAMSGSNPNIKKRFIGSKNDLEMVPLNNVTYDTWFTDLNGGRTEYVITIACMVGKSRMKGKKVVTNLVPYGPEKPRSGMVKSVETTQAEIHWDPPRGEFTKYTLLFEKVSGSGQPTPSKSISRLTSQTSYANEALGDLPTLIGPLPLEGDPYIEVTDGAGDGSAKSSRIRIKENLNHNLDSYTITGLEPGEKYQIELGTKTGTVHTKKPINDYLLTRPLPPANPSADSITPTGCYLKWMLPEGNSCIRGFQLTVRNSSDNKVVWERSVIKLRKFFQVDGLSPGTDYDVHFTSVADADKKRTESDHTEILVTTQLEKVRELRLEAATDSSLTVKWDPVKVVSTMTYRLEIKYVVAEGDEQEFNRIVDVPGDRKEETLADLSSGRAYVVSVTSLAKTVKDNEATSDAVKATFMTKPSAPTGLKPTKDGNSIQFMPSSKAQDYIVKWHLEPSSSIEETPKTDSLTVTKPQDQKDEESVTVLTTKNMPVLTPGIYTISVCSRVTDNGITTQSNELMESFILSEDVWSKADTAELDLVNMSRQTSRPEFEDMISPRRT